MIEPDRRINWTNSKPFVVTDDMMSWPWAGFRDGRTFRCHLCGAFFKPGDVSRLVLCNGIQEARDAGVHCGNVMVCAACDGDDIYVRLAEHGKIGKARYWSLQDPDRLPSNPNIPVAKRGQR